MQAVTGQSTFFAWLKKTKKEAKVLTAPKIFTKKFGILAGIMLSQCLYWTERSKDVRGWFHKKREEWQEELTMTEWEVRKALGILKSAGVIETRIHKIGSAPVTHHRVDTVQLIALMEEFPSCEFLKNQIPPSGEILKNDPEEFTLSYSTPESTYIEYPSASATEDTTMTTKGPQGSADAILKQFTASKSGVPVTGQSLSDVWKKNVPKYNKSLVPFMPSLTMKQVGQLKHLAKPWGNDAGGILLYLVQHWIDYAKFVQNVAGLKVIPKAPSIDFTLKYANEGKAYWTKHTKVIQSSPQVKDLPEGLANAIILSGIPAATEVLAVVGVKDEDDDEMTLEQLLAWKAKQGKK